MYWLTHKFTSLNEAKQYVDTTPAIESLRELIKNGHPDLVYTSSLEVLKTFPNIAFIETYKGQRILAIECYDDRTQKAWMQYNVLMQA